MMLIKNKCFNIRSIFLFVFTFIFSHQVLAQEMLSNEFFELSLEELMQVDVTIATKTHLKINDVPGMVSIINSDYLEARGFDTLWGALASLPGIQISIDSTGERLLVVRGIGKTYASGKVKLLLNGIAMNSTIIAGSEALMNLPVQQIKRIELIRGPGSAVHGEFSYAGVINVITKKTGRGLYAVLAEDNSSRMGGYYTWEDKKNDLSVSINFATSQSDGVDIDSGLDAGSLLGVPGYSSGLVNTKHDMNSLILSVDYGNSHTSLQWLEAKRGDYFGINDYLPPEERKNRIASESLSFHSDVDVQINPNLKLNAGISWLETSLAKKHQFLGSALIFGALETDPDVLSNVHVAEHRIELNLNLISMVIDKHVLFAELSSVKIDVDESDLFINLDPDTLLPSDTFFTFPTLINRQQDRDIFSITLQDEFSINSKLILTTGIRYDRYNNDIGSSTTPRLALVYHASDEHSFRAQYAEAFRPPTFLEVSGALSTSVSPETIKTIEFGHQYQTDRTLFKSVFFYSELNNLITFVNVAPFGFSNTDKATLKGVEFEYVHQINMQWKIESNLSLLKTEDKNTGNEIFGAASILANAQVAYKINSKVSVKSSLNYVGKRQREEGDARSDLEGYLINNISLSVKKLGDISGLTFHAGINNIFNQDKDFQAEIDTFENDYPFIDSASFWLQIGYAIE